MKIFKVVLFYCFAIIILFTSSCALEEQNNRTSSNVKTSVAKTTSHIPEHTTKTTKSITNKNPTDKVYVYFFDVGQADCTLIKSGTESMLIDAGNNNDAKDLIFQISNLGINHFDVLVATHPHEDHIGAMDEIIKEFGAERIYMPDVTYDSKTYIDMIAAIKGNDIPVIFPKAKDTFTFGEFTFTVMSPYGKFYDDINNYSIVLRMDIKDISFLFNGDAETKAEIEMRSNPNLDLNVDVLKVGHHGSGTSSTAQFIFKARPEYAVISVGANNEYGHPDPIIIKRLKKYGTKKIFRTDKHGTVFVSTDGYKLDWSFEGAKTPGKTIPESNTPDNVTVVQILALDKKAELVTIKNNTDKDIDMSGWKLKSVKGNQIYSFPEDYILKASSTITIASAAATGTLKWTKAHIWNNSALDPAELYDGTRLVDRWVE